MAITSIGRSEVLNAQIRDKIRDNWYHYLHYSGNLYTLRHVGLLSDGAKQVIAHDNWVPTRDCF